MFKIYRNANGVMYLVEYILETMLLFFNQIKFKTVVLAWLASVFVDLQAPLKLNPSALSVD